VRVPAWLAWQHTAGLRCSGDADRQLSSQMRRPRMRPYASCLQIAHASQTDIRNLIDRVVISRAAVQIHLSEVAEGTDSARILTLPWTRPSPYRKREIIQGADTQVAEMSCYSADEEITSVCADFLVERRGFEPIALAGAVRSRAILACC